MPVKTTGLKNSYFFFLLSIRFYSNQVFIIKKILLIVYSLTFALNEKLSFNPGPYPKLFISLQLDHETVASLLNVKYIYSLFPCFLLKGWLHKWSGSLEDEGLIKFYCQSELNFGLLPLPQMGHFTTVDFSIVINLPNNFLNSGSPLNKYKIVTRFFSLLLSKVKETEITLQRQLSMKTACLGFTPF